MMKVSYWRGALLGAVVVGVAAGCFDEMEDPAKPRVQASVVDQLSFEVRPAEQAFADLAEVSPSSAGFYIDEVGQLVVVVRDEKDHGQARSFMSARLNANAASLGAARGSGVRVQAGTYTFSELASWRDQLFQHAFSSIDGVTSLDLNERDNRVDVGYDPSVPGVRGEVERTINQLGIERAAVNVIIEEPIEPERRAPQPSSILQPSSITSRVDTLVGGIQIYASGTGTCSLGFVTSYGGGAAFVTASHCTADVFDQTNTDFGQPTWSAANKIGNEDHDPDAEGTYAGDPARDSDAAIIGLNDSIPSVIGLIANANASSTTWNTTDPYHIIVSESSATTMGSSVNKVGRSTGWTNGTITDTCEDKNYTLDYSVWCQYQGSYSSSGGDSGGPVFRMLDGQKVALLGIHTGGGGWWSRIAEIEDDLGSLSTTRGATLSLPTSFSGSVDGTYAALSWSAPAGATEYRIHRFIHNNGGSCTESDGYYEETSSTSWYDDTVSVTTYEGTTPPRPNDSDCYVEYWIWASNTTSYSNYTVSVYFDLED